MVASTAYQVHSSTAEAGRLLAEDASPVTMTKVYLDAAEHGDCALTARLTTSHSFSWCSAPIAWLTDAPELLDHRDVGTAEVAPTGSVGRTEECVSATIDQRGLSGADAQTLRWGWCWVRTADGWRVRDQGQG